MTTLHEQAGSVADEISDFCHQIKDHGTDIVVLPESLAAHDHRAGFLVTLGGVEYCVSVTVVMKGMAS